MTGSAPPTPGLRLILFDIDGTLMITKGASSRCLTRAGEIVIGPQFVWPTITPGQLDPQILAQLITDNGGEPTDTLVQQFANAYHDELEKELNDRQADITILPGISGLVDQLDQRVKQKRDVMIGVLTGNSRRATELKLTLSRLGLERFPVIICAEDGSSRNDLPRIAMDQAQQLTGQTIEPTNTFIIGDTPRDIACAHANGCVAVSVATGYYDLAQLTEAGADLALPTLEDAGPLMDRVFGNTG